MTTAELIEVSVIFIKQTDEAILVDDAGNLVWLPKSLIENPYEILEDIDKGDDIDIEIPEWLAEKKGLI